MAAGWSVEHIDGHDHESIAAAITSARASRCPTLIDCQTVIGHGAPNLAGSEKTHGSPLGDAEVAATRKNLGWSAPPFELPAGIVTAWRKAAARGAARNRQWQARLVKAARALPDLSTTVLIMGDGSGRSVQQRLETIARHWSERVNELQALSAA